MCVCVCVFVVSALRACVCQCLSALQQLPYQKETFDLSMDVLHMRAGWKSITSEQQIIITFETYLLRKYAVVSGEQCAMTNGICSMRMWCVSNWVTLALVSTLLRHFTDKAAGKYGWTTLGADRRIYVWDLAVSQVGA